MRFKKIDSNRHGHIVNVITDKGFCIGTIAKWHGLFIPTDWGGNKFAPKNTRKEAANQLEEHFEFEREALT